MPINRIFSVFRTAARGLEAQRVAMGVASENIANATTSRTADGDPYAIKRAVQEGPGGSAPRRHQFVRELEMALTSGDARHLSGASGLQRRGPEDLGPLTEVYEEAHERLEYDPTHPHADAEGYVHYPDVNVVEEMARMVSANRIYEANLSTIQAAKEMIKRTLEI